MNAIFLKAFESSPHDGCLPMGVDSAKWEPPAESIGSIGFIYRTRYGVDNPPTKLRMLEDGDRNVVEWSDGSLSGNVHLVDDTFRLQIEIPVDSTGVPGDWCTYIYGATAPEATGDDIISSLRFIDLEDRSRIPSAGKQR